MFPLLSHLFRGRCSPHVNYFLAGSPTRRQSGALAAPEEAPLLALAEFAVSLVEKMQAQEILRSLRLPEFDDLSQFFRNLPTTALVGIGAFAAVVAYWFASRPKAVKPPCDLRMQSEEVEVRLGRHGGGWISPGVCMGGRPGENGPCLGFRKPKQPYQWLSYREVAERAEALGSGLLQQGCKPSTKQFIGVFAQNRPEWIISELACYTYSMVVVPLYDTLGPGAIRYIVNTADISTVICDKPEKARTLLDHVERRETPGLSSIILMDPFEKELMERGRRCGVRIQTMQEVEVSLVSPSFSYTLPRGAPCAFFQSQWSPTCEDVHISYLPLAHMFERMVQSVVYCHGGRIGFFQGDIRLLSDDMKALRPTIFPVVPRLLNRMYDKVNTSLKRWILEFAAKRKKAEVRNGIIRNDSLWDKLFFNKIQASLGGCVRMIVTGAAPASPTVLGFLRAALGCQVYEGYGQTECTAGCTFTTPGDWTSGHVGAPLPCNLIRLKDVEELNYFASKGEGEICVKGPNVFKGYLKDEEKTTEALDQEGWLHTGDIGKWLPNGTLKIIDRKKHIFKLAQGEYIAPEKIENIYIRSDPVAQIYVHGDSLQAFLVGIVVPDSEVMPGWAKKRGFDGTYSELCKNKELKQAIMEDMVRLGKESGLHSFEQVKAIYIHSDMFSVQNGLLTPTLKAKRPELRDYFKKQIEELYSSISI
uniref:Arachidonate--CoA ligase n=1 Tax=Anser brachyrhynchus TaxID=132585 RepID=A0A8B9CF31_9AVES